MRKFSTRTMLIFVVCLVVGTILIGVGMAHVIRLKQRIFLCCLFFVCLSRSDAPIPLAGARVSV